MKTAENPLNEYLWRNVKRAQEENIRRLYIKNGMSVVSHRGELQRVGVNEIEAFCDEYGIRLHFTDNNKKELDSSKKEESEFFLLLV